ncbi:nodulation protein NodH [Aquicoccus sp. SCR17]|nr:nodulation protein NodH [Carideicomes alvinocaridis]
MTQPFDYFIVFAEMRTGSNFLEANLNAFPDLSCHGEAFNPHFIGYPNREELLGLDQGARDADPARLIEAVKAEPGVGGFRFFHDHDPRVLDIALDDPRCAKVVLTRNPLDSYVSRKIAQQTNQWKLTNVAKRKEGLAAFDAAEFEAHMAALQAFQVMLLNRLQASGQTAFYVAYEDLQDLAVMNGLAKFLGSGRALEALDRSLKRQNPEPVTEKVANAPEMEQALARLDRFNLNRTPNFEPRRGPMVPGYVAAPRSGLLCLPVRGGPEREVERWLAAIDGAAVEELQQGFTQKTLRQWMRGAPGHRSFAVIRHPLARAHAVFCERILSTGPGGFGRIRRVLRRHHGLDLPEALPDPGYDAAAHRLAFAGFLAFLKANLAGQTGVRVDAHWASQLAVLQGMTEFALPDMIIREQEMTAWLPVLARQVGAPVDAEPAEAPPDAPFTLAEIHDPELEALARDVYGRDYMVFGFGDWQAG